MLNKPDLFPSWQFVASYLCGNLVSRPAMPASSSNDTRLEGRGRDQISHLIKPRSPDARNTSPSDHGARIAIYMEVNWHSRAERNISTDSHWQLSLSHWKVMRILVYEWCPRWCIAGGNVSVHKFQSPMLSDFLSRTKKSNFRNRKWSN